eukprot:TRINITY_DN1890_c0_g1_i3.p1 TRINITY_DN1890_c0_g1~~TRINITY_DN1890_c0_g1_i3.p1  ORF type:complete len:222 (-),score=41.18 TRINITY_DN1890_c0_g1_i3:370-1035(-)
MEGRMNGIDTPGSPSEGLKFNRCSLLLFVDRFGFCGRLVTNVRLRDTCGLWLAKGWLRLLLDSFVISMFVVLIWSNKTFFSRVFGRFSGSKSTKPTTLTTPASPLVKGIGSSSSANGENKSTSVLSVGCDYRSLHFCSSLSSPCTKEGILSFEAAEKLLKEKSSKVDRETTELLAFITENHLLESGDPSAVVTATKMRQLHDSLQQLCAEVEKSSTITTVQ